MRFLLFAAAACFVAACARIAGAQEEALPAFAIVEDCGAHFVELNRQVEPTSMRWGVFGDVVDTYYGVAAFSHGQPDEPRRDDGTGRYQCTELVHRYLREVHHVPSRLGLGLGNGVDLARGVAERWGDRTWTGGVAGETPITLRYYQAGASRCRPTVGAIVSFAMAMAMRDGAPGPGHVAIIRAMNEKNSVLSATLFEQHGGGSYAPDHIVRPGIVRFVRDEAGVWNGVYTTDRGRTFPVVGWTNVVVND
jgi:hypothetical protein